MNVPAFFDKISGLQGIRFSTLFAGRLIVEELMKLNRNRDYYRKQRKRIIRNKSRLLWRLGGSDVYEGWTRGYSGRLAKGKIHCSCRMCRTKSYDCFSHKDAKRRLDEHADGLENLSDAR